MHRFHMVARTVIACAAVTLAAAFPASASAAFVVRPVDVTASSNHDSNRNAESTIDNSGINDASLVQTGDPVPSDWPGHNNGCCGQHWITDSGDTAPTITFDLGAVYPLSGARVWNHNNANQLGRGSKGVQISFSTDNSSFFGTISTTFSKASGTNSYDGEDHPFSATPTVRYVEFDIQGNHSDGSKDRAGLSEVRFTAIPEPGSLALLAPAGLIVFRRKREPVGAASRR